VKTQQDAIAMLRAQGRADHMADFQKRSRHTSRGRVWRD
jgi:hypothetical protein